MNITDLQQTSRLTNLSHSLYIATPRIDCNMPGPESIASSGVTAVNSEPEHQEDGEPDDQQNSQPDDQQAQPEESEYPSDDDSRVLRARYPSITSFRSVTTPSVSSTSVSNPSNSPVLNRGPRRTETGLESVAEAAEPVCDHWGSTSASRAGAVELRPVRSAQASQEDVTETEAAARGQQDDGQGTTAQSTAAKTAHPRGCRCCTIL